MTVIRKMQVVLYVLEVVACITGIFYWKHIKTTVWRWFVLYLGFVVAAEQLGNYLSSIKELLTRNMFINWFVIPAEFIFFFWFFYTTGELKKGRLLAMSCTAAYIAALVADFLFVQQIKTFFYSFSYSIGNLAILVMVVAFFIQLMNSEAIIHYKTNRLFWVALGLLIFYLGTLPFFGLMYKLHAEYPGIYRQYLKAMFVCNWIMYLLFIVSIICRKPR